MSTGWHEYEKGWQSGWLPAAVLLMICVVALLRARRRIPRPERLFYAGAAAVTLVACWDTAFLGLILLCEGFAEVLLGLLARAPCALATAVLFVLARKVFARDR